jgi:hypothetical protein
MTHVIVPAFTLVRVPMFTGLEKLPDELDNWAVKTLPAFAGASIVKLTFIELPAHRLLEASAEVAMEESTEGELIVKFTFEISKNTLPMDSTFILAFVLVTLGMVTCSEPSLAVLASSVCG